MPLLIRALLGLLLVLGTAWPALARPLTVNATFEALKQAHVLLYDLPEEGDRDSALAYIREIRGDFYPHLELVDARRTPRSEWAPRLASGFVLYGVMATGSVTAEVLTHTFGGLTLGPGRVESPLVQGAGPELRLITVGRNPFGPGPALVYAAERNDQLAGINEAFHGPRSFHLFSRNKTLQAGDFNQSFRRIPSELSVPEAQADARELFSSLERIHPRLLARMSRARYEALKQETERAIAESAHVDRVPVRELASVLYRAAAAFQDGHTSLHWQDSPDPGARYPAFRLTYSEGRFMVARALGMPGLEGLEVVSLDGKPTMTFLAPILERCSGELPAFKAQRFQGNEAFYWSLTHLLARRDRLAVTVRRPDGRLLRLVLPTVPLESFEQLEAEPASRQMALRFPRPDVAIFYYPSFEFSPEAVRQVEGVFRVVAARKPKALVMDLRGNGGGNSGISDVILRHLTRQKVRQFSRIDLKVSPETLEAFPDWFEGATASVGEVVVATSSVHPLERTRNVFSGRLYVLVDEGTFSAAADFAAMVKGFRLGTLVGRETGGLPHSFGDVITKYLPNSDIPYGVSCKEFFAPVPEPGDDRHGVRPDVAVTEQVLKRYAGKADPVLEYALELAVKK